jgi:protein involved in polysaccharide export with SLBB domain
MCIALTGSRDGMTGAVETGNRYHRDGCPYLSRSKIAIKRKDPGLSVRANSAGTSPMPFLGHIVANQKTPEELEEVIEEWLRGDYLKNPHVTVVLLQHN